MQYILIKVSPPSIPPMSSLLTHPYAHPLSPFSLSRIQMGIYMMMLTKRR